MIEARAYWVVRPGAGELRSERLPAVPGPGASRVRAEFSAVSVGTERLVGLGKVPAAVADRMACRGMAGSFALPVKYGYCLVGTAIAGALAGQRVFTMHPHQDVADVADAAALPLPSALAPRRAVLIPNLETALNAVWDAELAAGESVAVFGAGAVGLLIAYVVHRRYGLAPTIVEAAAPRRRLAAALPFVGAVHAPGAGAEGTFAVAFHATGTGQGLQAAVDAVGFEGRVLDLSWYGTQPVTLDLGATFHCGRKRIVASQVGTVARSKRATYGPRERMQEVLDLLAPPAGDEGARAACAALDLLLGASIAFAELPACMRSIYDGIAPAIVPVVHYGGPCASS